jgi:hypothetical protein
MGSIFRKIKVMKIHLGCIVLFILFSRSVFAQEHLVPDTSQLVLQDSYSAKIHHIFDQAFDEEVILRAIVLPARLRVTNVVGVHVKDDKSEVFAMEASDIWTAEMIERSENQIKALTDAGEKVPTEMIGV